MEVRKKELFSYGKQIFLRQFTVAVVICILAALIHKDLFYSWFIGCVVALFDTGLVLQGIVKGAQKGHEEALNYMHKTMLERLGIIVVIVLVMLKLKLSVIGIFLSFLLLHIFLVINLIIIARRDKTKRTRP
jgi:hypothetical protein